MKSFYWSISHAWTLCSHKAIMDAEVEFLHKSLAKQNSKKLLMEHIERMASGEAPFFPTTLSLVYDTLVEGYFPQTTTSGPHPGKSPGDQGVTNSTNQATNSTSQVNPPSAPRVAWLECTKCGAYSGLNDLYEGMRCPICPETGVQGGRPCVKCQLCNVIYCTHREDCVNRMCGARFV